MREKNYLFLVLPLPRVEVKDQHARTKSMSFITPLYIPRYIQGVKKAPKLSVIFNNQMRSDSIFQMVISIF